MRFWDVEGRRDVKRFVGHTASVWAVALSPTASSRSSGSMDGTARVWDVASGQQLQKFAEHVELVSAVAFTPNGKWGVSGGFDGVVAAWKVASGEEVWRVEKLGIVTAHRGGPARASRRWSRPNRVRHLLDLADRQDDPQRTASSPTPVGESRHQPEREVVRGRRATTGPSACGSSAKSKAAFTLTGHEGPVRSVAVKDGGRWVLSAGADRTVRLWDTAQRDEEGRRRLPQARERRVVGAAFLANGTQTLSGDRDVTVLPWKIDKFLATPTRVPSRDMIPSRSSDRALTPKPLSVGEPTQATRPGSRAASVRRRLLAPRPSRVRQLQQLPRAHHQPILRRALHHRGHALRLPLQVAVQPIAPRLVGLCRRPLVLIQVDREHRLLEVPLVLAIA